ncbi:replication protein A 32 kDa subunit-like [Littorina saxatilis]|uniref:Replication protein A C-terminal domain-containing protein n=1 Tax=Littorina saxatilis TaxID=31220 RepID=A0AAN9B8F8_9CAEN
MWNDQGGFNQGGGGGFDNQGGFSSPGGFGTPQPDEKKGRSRAQNLVPVTVAQILNSSVDNDRFFSGSLEISQVTMIGLIRSVRETATRIDYELDDMTGPPLEVKQFVDNDENVPEEERVPTMRENTYVRVYGHVRSFSGKKNVVAFNISPVEDMNQLTCHILSTIYAHASTNLKQATGGNQMNNTAGTSNAGDQGGSSIYGLSALNNQIANIIRSCNSEMGASVADVSQQLKGVPEKAIREALEFLSGEGHIYSTIDDDHFKATDG